MMGNCHVPFKGEGREVTLVSAGEVAQHVARWLSVLAKAT